VRASGAVVWLTGLPATGKSTVARILETELSAAGVATLVLDSDDLRSVLTPQATFSEAERDFFYGAVGHLAELGAKGGAVVIVAATAPKRCYRDRVREHVARFIEVLLICTPELLEERDPKGLYARFAKAEIANLPGRDAAYEDPTSPELVFDTSRSRAIDIAKEIADELERGGPEETQCFAAEAAYH
jgi:adenylylsulfate kinase